MKHVIERELREICRDIVDRDQSLDDWREAESSDEWQGERYHGGFEAEEDAFCFSYYSPDGPELWLQFTLEEAAEIAEGAIETIDARDAE